MEILILIVAFAFLCAARWVSKSAWIKGKVGERRVKGTLRRKLNSRDYRVVNDLVLPTRDHGTTQIDHLVVSRFGIFVIETKNMSGGIFGGERSVEWAQVIYGWKSRFQNPLRQNYKHVKAVQHVFGLASHQVHSVVVFVGTAEPKSDMPDNIIWGKNVLPYFIKTYLKVVINEQELDEITEILSTASPKRILQGRSQNQKASKLNFEGARQVCKQCDAAMEIRTNRRTGKDFWGCSEFPRCKNTRPMN